MFQITNLIKTPIAYKILVDVFLILLFITSGFIVVEVILPGLISAYISPFILFGSAFLIITLLSFIARKQGIYTHISKSNTILLIVSTLLFIILISIANIGYGLFFSSIIIIFSITIFLLFYFMLQDTLHKK